jgi:hypothetical protein
MHSTGERVNIYGYTALQLKSNCSTRYLHSLSWVQKYLAEAGSSNQDGPIYHQVDDFDKVLSYRGLHKVSFLPNNGTWREGLYVGNGDRETLRIYDGGKQQPEAVLWHFMQFLLLACSLCELAAPGFESNNHHGHYDLVAAVQWTAGGCDSAVRTSPVRICSSP